MKDNIVLTGIMGCGKTTLGRLLADRLSMTFVDMDALIEEEMQMTIIELFTQFGEPYFRDKETELCHRLAKRSGLVISTGGGIIGREENMKALGRSGQIVFVDRDPKIIIETIDASNRPLIRDNPRRLLELHAQRLPLYRKYADLIFTNNTTIDNAIVSLMTLLQNNEKR